MPGGRFALCFGHAFQQEDAMRGIRCVSLLGALLVSLVALSLGAQLKVVSADAPSVYHVRLTGANEVPVRDTPAHANVVLRINSDETELDFNLHATNLLGAFVGAPGAHIHRGARGANGPIVVHFTMSCVERNNSVHCRGTVTDPALVATVADMIADGVAYVNVHSTVFPPGEVRGQIE
jgi:hypothetical protein